MSDLLTTYTGALHQLAAASTLVQTEVAQDAASALTMAGFWLDPVYWRCPDGEWVDMFYEDEDYFFVAQNITRRLFPDLYADMTIRMWAGESESHIDRALCSQLAPRIPGEIVSLESLWNGVDNEWYGIDWREDTEGVKAQSLMQMFGIETPEDSTLTCRAAEILADGYKESCPEIRFLLEWLFSFSSNSLVDYSYAEAWEVFTDPLGWDESEFAFAWVMQNEADNIMALAHQGYDLLTTSTEALADFCNDLFTAINLAIGEMLHERRGHRNPTFQRPGVSSGSPEAAPDAGNQLLHLRDRHASHDTAGDNRENRIA